MSQPDAPGRLKKVVSGVTSPLAGRYLAGRSLVVLCYHRIVDQVEPGLFGELKSATPVALESQLDLISSDHEFVNERSIIDWLDGRGTLPERPVLLTFDDGYRDNYETVFPLLKDRGIPATFFLATGHMDDRSLLWWDLASALFQASDLSEMDLPIIGHRNKGESAVAALATEWIEAAKRAPDRERRDALAQLPDALGVTSLPPAPDVSMTWDQAREMADNGMSFGGHTRSHPILSRMGGDQSHADIADGLVRIREELGSEVSTFAYPNGGSEDYGERESSSLRALGVRVAFSLVTGPAMRREVEQDPMDVRRIYVGEKDTLESLRLKMHGVGRLLDRVRG